MITVFRALENDEQEFLMMIKPGRLTAPCQNSFVKPLANLDFGPRQIHFDSDGGASQSFDPSLTELVQEHVTQFYQNYYSSHTAKLIVEKYVR